MSRMSQPIRGYSGHFGFQNATKSYNIQGTFLACLATFYEVVIESRKYLGKSEVRTAMLVSQLPWQVVTLLQKPRGTFLASPVIPNAVFLEKLSKMSLPIRGNGGHLRFLITTKYNNTSS